MMFASWHEQEKAGEALGFSKKNLLYFLQDFFFHLSTNSDFCTICELISKPRNQLKELMY